MKTNTLFKLQSIVAIALVSSVACAADKPAQTTSQLGDSITISGDKMQDYLNYLNGSGSNCSQQDELVNTDSQNAQQAQQTLLQAQQTAADAQEKGREAIRAANADESVSANNYTTTVEQLQTKLAADIADQNNKNAAAIQKLREEATQLDTAISTANQTLRAAQDAVANSKTDAQAACRNAADKAGTDEKTKLDTKAKTLINYATSNLAGAANRAKSAYTQNIQNAYMVAYTNCMNGTSGPGADAQAAMAKAQQAFQSAQATWAEAQASIKKQQAQLDQDLQLAQQQGQTALATIAANAKSAIDAAARAYQNSMTADNLKIVNANDEITTQAQYQTQAIQMDMTSLQSANQRMMTATMGAQSCQANSFCKGNANNPQCKALAAAQNNQSADPNENAPDSTGKHDGPARVPASADSAK